MGASSLMPGGDAGPCGGGDRHTWSEWRYDESAAGAVRSCQACGLVAARNGRVISRPATPATPAVTLQSVLQSLDQSVFAEELKGDLATAREQADAMCAAAASPEATADALIVRAVVGTLQGEPAAADAIVDKVGALVPSDVNRRLRALTCALFAMHQRYNAFPDGAGVGATEVSARWTVEDLTPLDAEWQQAVRAASDREAQFEAWLVYSFLCQLQPLRYTFETSRYSPLPVPREQMMAMALGPSQQLRTMAEQASQPRLAAFADWSAADLQHRSRDGASAQATLARARAAYRAGGDSAGEALCLMTAADWEAAPFSTPLAWNLALSDSSSQGSNLFQQIESDEFGGGRESSYDEAEALFAQGGARRGAAAIQLRRGYGAMLRDDWPAAGACAIRARDDFASSGDRRGEHLASTHLLMCQLSGAGVAGVDVAAIARSIGEWGETAGSFSFTLGLGVLVNRLGRHWLVRRGHYERALACSRAAQALFTALGARINAAQCVVDQGVIHQATGERSLALTFLMRALDEYEALVAVWPRVADNLRTRVVFLAVDVYQLALQQCDSDGMERAAARLTGQLPDIGFEPVRQMAMSLIAQSAVLAPLYRSRIEKARGHENDARRLIEQSTAALDGVPEAERHFLEAAVFAESKEFARAASAIEQHLRAGGANAGFVGQLTEVMKATGGAHGAAEAVLQDRRTHEQALSAFVMVRAYVQAHEHLQALERLAGPEWWKSDARPWQPLSDAGLMYEGLGDAASAFACYDRAIEELESRRSALSRDELKVALASDKGAQYLYFLAARAAVRGGDAARGFEYGERGKSRALLDLMAAARMPASANEDQAAAAWRESSMQALNYRVLLARARSQESPDAVRIAGLEAQVAEQESRLAAAEQALARVNPRFHDAVNPAAAMMGIDAVRRALAPGTVLLEFAFLGDDLLAWAIGRDADPVAHHAALDVVALRQTIRAFHDACQDGTAYEDAGAELEQILLAPLARAIRSSTAIIVVPHGAAHALPFHALPFEGQPLAAGRTMTYLPSASTLQFIETPMAGPTPERILIVGNPTLDLSSARTEAEFVARQFEQPLLLLEDAATEEQVRTHIADYPLLHFATHGTLDEEVPLNSSLALAGGASLTVYELMLLRLRAQLVVLSACSTGQGETTGGDDVLGLTRGLLAAGARSAVVSLWPVDDQSTALMMEAFYRALRGGANPAAALRAAQDDLRQRKSRGYDHPYYWAPFVMVGVP
ncbi:MAG TPA: CHAT domain-containing protein [Vicinamibacterales bacterium]|nr:CHAT domain-containing protein [Vicinamibacterales bacterium]